MAKPAIAQDDKRPNFLVIVAADLGFSDIGTSGAEIGRRMTAERLGVTDWPANAPPVPRLSAPGNQTETSAGSDWRAGGIRTRIITI